jgi:septum formation protein
MEFRQILQQPFVLASASPRRKQLMEQADFKFRICVADVDESFSDDLKEGEIPIYLSQLKANAVRNEIQDKEIIVAADTIVWLNNRALNKPENEAEAFRMIKELSGNTHKVFTGVTLLNHQQQISFAECTEVKFRMLQDEEVNYYIQHYKPFDKAGSYGAQDWIGLTGIQSLKGCYFNVMGLPVNAIYEQLKHF